MNIRAVTLANFKSSKNNAFNSKKRLAQPPYFSNVLDSYSFTGKIEISRTKVLEIINTLAPLSNAGLKGIVYKFDEGNKSYAIKVARLPEYKFENEAEVLKQVPNGINCQRYVSYFQDPKTNCDILVSTFVEGSKGVLKSKDDFNNFLELLLKLDKSGVLHGDLNMQNCLLNSEGIGLIDFGEGEIFKTGDSYDDFIYPNFILKSNIINLEHNGIPDCIKTWQKEGTDPKECFKNYLSAKSKYYKTHAQFLDAKSKEAIDFEQNYSRVLKNPSDLVLENELRRIDCLYTFEHADTAVNYKNIPNSAIEIWNLTVQKAQEQLDFINSTLENSSLTADERKYFEYQKEIISLFCKQFSSWSTSTIKWLNSLENKKNLSEIEKRLVENKDKSMPLPPNLTEMVLN